ASVPWATAKRSVWAGWTCAAATAPPGWTTVSTTTASPSVSAEVARKVRRSPVAVFSMVSPVRIILASFGVGIDTSDAASAGVGNRRLRGRFDLRAEGDLRDG